MAPPPKVRLNKTSQIPEASARSSILQLFPLSDPHFPRRVLQKRNPALTKRQHP